MAYAKDYYHILGLDVPGWRSAAAKQQHVNFTADLRRAYKAALLAAHPDKKKTATNTGAAAAAAAAAGGAGYTIDDIKQAYTTLSDPKSRAEYENWYLHHRHDDNLRSPSFFSSSAVQAREKAANADFVLGLEVLDLSEFDQAAAQGNDEAEEHMQWTRACRCGAEKGFLILEAELEDAESRGEKEVLVGCEGCSLWVRVGFDVEEE